MKKNLGTILLLLFTTIAFAQQDKKAKEILDQVSEKVKSYETISAEIAYTLENKEEKISEKSTYSLKLKGDKYRLLLPDIGIQYYSDGQTIWAYQEDGNQVSISNREDSEDDLMDPAKIFQIYEEGFDYKFIEEKKEKGQSVYYIDLIPQTDDQDFKKITMCIDKTTMLIKKAITYGHEGNVYILEIAKMETNKPMAESTFVFNTANYHDIEIIDFR